MKAIKCEMCDSTSFAKKGDYFVCQDCGMKYDKDAAKALMVEVEESEKPASTASTSPFVIEGKTLVKYTGNDAIVDLPDKVVVIGPEAFAYHTEIREVRQPLNMFDIKDGAFKGCSSLISLGSTEDRLNPYVFSVGENAFDGCVSFQGGHNRLPLHVCGSIGDYAFKDCPAVKVDIKLEMDEPLTISENAFSDSPGPHRLILDWKDEWESQEWEGSILWRPEGAETECLITGVDSDPLKENLALSKFMPDCVVNSENRLCTRIHAEALRKLHVIQTIGAASMAQLGGLCPECNKGVMHLDPTGGKILSARKAAMGAILAGPAGAVVGASMGEASNLYVCDFCGHAEVGTARRGHFTGRAISSEEFGLFEITTWEEFRKEEKRKKEEAQAGKKAEEELKRKEAEEEPEREKAEEEAEAKAAEKAEQDETQNRKIGIIVGVAAIILTIAAVIFFSVIQPVLDKNYLASHGITESIAVGDTIIMGTYEQDGDKTDGREDVQWTVLAVSGDKILVISSYVLDVIVPYNEDRSYGYIDATSSYTSWTGKNGNPIAFSGAERRCIEEILFLTKNDVRNYIRGRVSLHGATPYASHIGCDGGWLTSTTKAEFDKQKGRSYCKYWYVSSSGQIKEDTHFNIPRGVRPAMWISL